MRTLKQQSLFNQYKAVEARRDMYQDIMDKLPSFTMEQQRVYYPKRDALVKIVRRLSGQMLDIMHEYKDTL